jgi:hypothetical protein
MLSMLYEPGLHVTLPILCQRAVPFEVTGAKESGGTAAPETRKSRCGLSDDTYAGPPTPKT